MFVYGYTSLFSYNPADAFPSLVEGNLVLLKINLRQILYAAKHHPSGLISKMLPNSTIIPFFPNLKA